MPCSKYSYTYSTNVPEDMDVYYIFASAISNRGPIGNFAINLSQYNRKLFNDNIRIDHLNVIEEVAKPITTLVKGLLYIDVISDETEGNFGFHINLIGKTKNGKLKIISFEKPLLS